MFLAALPPANAREKPHLAGLDEALHKHLVQDLIMLHLGSIGALEGLYRNMGNMAKNSMGSASPFLLKFEELERPKTL